jgi:hypothetical protein
MSTEVRLASNGGRRVSHGRGPATDNQSFDYVEEGVRSDLRSQGVLRCTRGITDRQQGM